MTRAAIAAIRSYLPSGKLTNEQLAREWGDWDARKIFDKTGISERPVAGAGECASDLGVAAAKRLFEDGLCRREEVDYLIFCTQSPDYFLPATACLVQERLGLGTHCGALDINQGCSGFVYGLSLAKGLVETGVASKVLLITAETYSKYIHPDDRGVRTIFGDGAAATLVSPVESQSELIGPFVLGTDGRGACRLIVASGAARQPRTSQAPLANPDELNANRAAEYLYMDGPEILNFTIREIPGLVSRLLNRAALQMDHVSYFVFHQANKFMLEHLRKKLRIPEQRFCVNLERCGNTVSSTIPLSLQALLEEGRIAPGDRVMLVGFGVGYSWAAAMIQVV